MKLILDDIVNEELKKYLLMQDGIDGVVFDNENFLAKLNIEYNKKLLLK